MGWSTIEDWSVDPPVQVVPDTDSLWPQHILDDNCWCQPYRPDDEPRMLIHRDVAKA